MPPDAPSAAQQRAWESFRGGLGAYRYEPWRAPTPIRAEVLREPLPMVRAASMQQPRTASPTAAFAVFFLALVAIAIGVLASGGMPLPNAWFAAGFVLVGIGIALLAGAAPVDGRD